MGRNVGCHNLSEDEKQIFLATLAERGTYAYAAAKARGLLPLNSERFRKYGDYAEETFKALERRDLLFAEAVKQAKSLAVGQLESLLHDRINTPDVHESYDKQTGQLVGRSVQWRSANVMLLRALERHVPEWIQRKQIDGNQTVTINRGSDPQRSGVLLTAEDIRRLPEDRRLLLSQLLDEISALADAEKAALPAPEQPLLPGPTETPDAE